MSKDILPTVDKQANTYHELQLSIYMTSKLDTKVLRDSITKPDRIAYMRQEFDKIRRETEGQLKIVEKDQSSGGTNVIFRKEVGGKLSGKGTERLFHGQTVELVGNEKNEGGYYEIGEGKNGEKHIYIKVKTQNGETGFIAAEHLGYDKIPGTPPEEPKKDIPPAPEKKDTNLETGTGTAEKDKDTLDTGTGKATKKKGSTLDTGTADAKDGAPSKPGSDKKGSEKRDPSLDTGTGESSQNNNPLETGTGNAKNNPSPINTGTGKAGEQGNSNKEVPKKVETPAEKAKREQEVLQQLQEMKQKLKKGADTVSSIAQEFAKGLGATTGSIFDKAYDLKKNGDKVKAEKFQESWKKETAMPEAGTLLRKTEAPQTTPKKNPEKPHSGIMGGLDDIKRTNGTITTEKPLEKTDSETKTENLRHIDSTETGIGKANGNNRIIKQEAKENVDPNPEIILINNKIYQRRGFWPVYEYLQMYVDPQDKTLKSYSYFASKRLQGYSDALKTGKAKALSYNEASKLSKGKTDKNGEIWIPETKNTTPENIPLEEKRDKETLARELGSGLASTFRVLGIDKSLADSVSNLLVDQNFNLVLDSGEPLTYFTFNGQSIESKWFGKQEITGLEVQGKALIITEKNGEKLSFAPPKG